MAPSDHDVLQDESSLYVQRRVNISQGGGPSLNRLNRRTITALMCADSCLALSNKSSEDCENA